MLLEGRLIESGQIEERVYPRSREGLPPIEIREGRYLARFVDSVRDLDKVLELRFGVFNLELGEGLDASFLTGRDEDQYDLTCHHLAVFDEKNRPVGTYRIQTSAMAAAAGGFYSATEFDLQLLPAELIDKAVELGRACISPLHRNSQVLFLLWKGLASYLTFNSKRYLFGCCSLSSQDVRQGLAAYEQIVQEGRIHPRFMVKPKPGYECDPGGFDSTGMQPAKLPRLFRTYLRFGAKVCGLPAIDREFKTIDFLVLFDIAEMDESSRRMFFGT